ncbi:MAG: hypothetical protein AB7P02_09415 [Alphaproteobacteria bacterium]
MTIPISAKTTQRVVPAAYGPAARALAEAAGDADLSRFDDPPAYIVTVPTLMQRAAWRRDVGSAGAKMYSDDALIVELRRQVAAAYETEDPDRDRIIGIIDAYARGEASAEEAAEFNRLQDVVRRSSATFAEMCADRAHYMAIAPYIACRHFLKARENPEHVYRRKNGLVTEEELAAMAEEEIAEIGTRIMMLMIPTQAQLGNSGSPSPSHGEPQISPADPMHPMAADGSSSANTTSEIPASA